MLFHERGTPVQIHHLRPKTNYCFLGIQDAGLELRIEVSSLTIVVLMKLPGLQGYLAHKKQPTFLGPT